VTPARLAARCSELLGAVDGPVIVDARGPFAAALARTLPAARDAAPVAAVCSFLGERVETRARRRRLETLGAALSEGARLVVVDHNRPRRWWRRIRGAVALAVRGLAPSRACHPVAREVRDMGFTIERLRLASGERVQLVVARKR